MSDPQAITEAPRRRFLKGAAARGSRRRRAGLPERGQGAGPHLDALAEHLAGEGHLPRVRERLRQEGQRHDRRRRQDRGVARGRGRAGLRPARCRVQGHARRRPRRPRLPLRQADGAGAVGLGPGVSAWTPTCSCPGTSTAGASSSSTSSTSRSTPTSCRFPYGPMPTQPLGWFKKPITKPDDFKGLKFRTVGISIDVFTGLGAAVNALPGGDIVPAMDRGLLDAAEFNNATSDRILGFADVSKVCMLQSYHQNAEQFEILFNKTKYDALPDKIKAHHRDRRRGRLGRHVVEGGRPVLEGLRRAADEGQGPVLQDAGLAPAEAARGLRRRRRQEGGRQPAVQGDRASRCAPSPPGR